MHASEVRRRVLLDHGRLRSHLDELETPVDRVRGGGTWRIVPRAGAIVPGVTVRAPALASAAGAEVLEEGASHDLVLRFLVRDQELRKRREVSPDELPARRRSACHTRERSDAVT